MTAAARHCFSSAWLHMHVAHHHSHFDLILLHNPRGFLMKCFPSPIQQFPVFICYSQRRSLFSLHIVLCFNTPQSDAPPRISQIINARCWDPELPSTEITSSFPQSHSQAFVDAFSEFTSGLHIFLWETLSPLPAVLYPQASLPFPDSTVGEGARMVFQAGDFQVKETHKNNTIVFFGFRFSKTSVLISKTLLQSLLKM